VSTFSSLPHLFQSFSQQTILVITHRLGGLEQFDRLMLFAYGQLRQVNREELHEALSGELIQSAETVSSREGLRLSLA
jgi:ABC-type transport system involved in cytochrome bd biosynthesis fused ATPase/permease subunit